MKYTSNLAVGSRGKRLFESPVFPKRAVSTRALIKWEIGTRRRRASIKFETEAPIYIVQ